MKCSRCGREISEDESYVSQGKVFCDDCLIDIGLSGKGCDPWATYINIRTKESSGLKGADGLTDIEKKVYEFVKSKDRATREEVMRDLDLSEADLKTRLVPLMHGGLIKEHSEGNTMYLIPTLPHNSPIPP